MGHCIIHCDLTRLVIAILPPPQLSLTNSPKPNLSACSSSPQPCTLHHHTLTTALLPLSVFSWYTPGSSAGTTYRSGTPHQLHDACMHHKQTSRKPFTTNTHSALHTHTPQPCTCSLTSTPHHTLSSTPAFATSCGILSLLPHWEQCVVRYAQHRCRKRNCLSLRGDCRDTGPQSRCCGISQARLHNSCAACEGRCKGCLGTCCLLQDCQLPWGQCGNGLHDNHTLQRASKK
jgi:hypothetical protein